MVEKLSTPEGRRLYARRKQTVEPVFGIIKSVMGFRSFRLRGRAKVQGEWSLVCLAYNFKRLWKLMGARRSGPSQTDGPNSLPIASFLSFLNARVGELSELFGFGEKLLPISQRKLRADGRPLSLRATGC